MQHEHYDCNTIATRVKEFDFGIDTNEEIFEFLRRDNEGNLKHAGISMFG